MAQLDRVNRDLGYGRVGEVDPDARDATDIAFAASFVDVLDGLVIVGPGGCAVLGDS